MTKQWFFRPKLDQKFWENDTVTNYRERKVFTQGNSLCVTIPAKLKATFPEGTEVTPILTAKGLLFALRDTSPIGQPEPKRAPRPVRAKPKPVVTIQPVRQKPLKPTPILEPKPEPVTSKTSYREPISSRFLGNLINLGTHILKKREPPKEKQEEEYCI